MNDHYNENGMHSNPDSNNHLKSHPLGMEDASKEDMWRDFPKMYIHIDSYEDFIDKEKMFIFGKRGVGKTAMMKMIEHEISHKKNKKINRLYSMTGTISTQDVLAKQLSLLRGLGQVDLHTKSAASRELWRLSFEHKMIEILSACKEPALPKDLNAKLVTYLKENKILNLFEEVGAKLINNSSNQISTAAAVGTAVLESRKPQHKDIFSEALAFSKKEKIKVLIMMDSLDTYEQEWDDFSIVIEMLFNAIFELKEPDMMYVKVFFPSELYHNFGFINLGKFNSSILHIKWTNKEIASFIALRLNRYLEWVNKHSHFNKSLRHNATYSYNILKDMSYEDIMDVIYQAFPKLSLTKCNDYVDTLMYIEAHTLLRPRQVIILFNYIIRRYQLDNKDKELFPKKNDVSKYLHQGLSKISVDYFHAYDNLVKFNFGTLSGTVDAIFTSGKSKPKIFYTHSEMNRNLKNVAPDEHRERMHILSVLINFGILGGCKATDLNEQQIKVLQNSNGRDLPEKAVAISVPFIYHLEDKDKYFVNIYADYFFIHPMFYQHLGCQEKNHIFVIPSHVLASELYEE